MESDTQMIKLFLVDIENVRSNWSSDHNRNPELAKTFNVFSLCGIDHYETWHSRILAEFLDPKGSHNQSVKFLNLFVERFLREKNGRICFSAKAQVSTEVTSYVKNLRIGRFDILIEDEDTKSVCIIENKIFAEEQTEQLSRYATWLKEERNGWATCLVFLTLDGHDSSTIKEGQEYIRLAYYREGDSNLEPKKLVDWIADCSNSVKETPRLFYTLVQYIDHVKKLATGEIAMSNEIIKSMTGHMKAAKLVYENYQRACVQQANHILKTDVINKLNENGGAQWEADGSCLFSVKEKGVRYFRKNSSPDANLGQIWVYFAETNLSECQIALWQEDDNENIVIDPKQLKEKSYRPGYKQESWHVETSGSYTMWRGIDPDGSDKTNGLNWDATLFDESDFKTKVVEDIVKSIEALFRFQNEYGSQILFNAKIATVKYSEDKHENRDNI